MKKSKPVIFGPAMLVTAAFIGPGTVFTASQAGAKFGFSLLWTVVFATATGIILQEMAGRLGIATGSGLAQAIRRSIKLNLLRWFILGLVLIGIFVGNSAFQTGNLLGAAAGLEVLSDHWFEHDTSETSRRPLNETTNEIHGSGAAPDSPVDKPGQSIASTKTVTSWKLLSLIGIAVVAWSIILIGRFEWIQRILTLLVGFMSITFLLAALLSNPNLTQVLYGLIPSVPPGSGWVIISLIGTTVVPYNLFLHASAAAHRWPAESVRKTSDKEKAVKDSAKNTRFAVGIGGLITAAILITAAVAFESDRLAAINGQSSTNLSKVGDIAMQLEPALGSWAKLLFGLGLFGAGLTSAITAPVAAAFAVAGSFGWPNKVSDWRLKGVASVVLLTGCWFAIQFGASPQDTVLMAQAANGLLLPALAVLLLVMMNRVDLMTRFHNRPMQNLVATTVIVIVTLITVRQVVILYPKIRDRLTSQSIDLISKPLTVSLAKEV